MTNEQRIDLILSTLNAMEVGTLDSIRARLREVQAHLAELGEAELAARADAAGEALARGDVVEFKRVRATLQAKVGHLR
jgi:hypothetical protein